ncbi:hypothetical protein DPMN_153902 [Dreissena polymorpha]|uniref:Uncharacterized protein n=1 Tax=Dreissena polymorpha TaxID=45954 RepID=A0A9D4J8M8_DREPO|nr:hypothetical protein DPMN_153902 [Dreissena polymorpha]
MKLLSVVTLWACNPAPFLTLRSQPALLSMMTPSDRSLQGYVQRRWEEPGVPNR